MKLILSLVLCITVQVFVVQGITLPEEIEMSFRKDGRRIPGREDLYGEQKEFIDYVTANWREIAANIECLPPLDGVEIRKGVKFNCSVINFGYACCNLPPVEYLEFFGQLTTLHEEKRISFTAFKNLYYGGYGKENFWSVNWEHPGVQAIFERIRRFDPPPDASFMEMVEDQAAGKLADNYMVNRGDNDPLPQTLPGIKLQRPFASVIRKYEAMTGKKIPPDPDFPEVEVTRQRKRNPQESTNSQAGLSPVDGRSEFRWALAAALLALALAVTVFIRGTFRKRWRKSNQYP